MDSPSSVTKRLAITTLLLAGWRKRVQKLSDSGYMQAASKRTYVIILTIGTLRSNDADGNDNVKKTMGFISKTITSQVYHAFLYISLPVFARLRRENA